MIIPEGDEDDFFMNEVQHSSLDMDLPKEAAYIATGKAAKPLFSSPQNRRSSIMRMSQKSQHSSITDNSIRGGRGGDGRGGEIDNSLRGGVSSQIVQTVPLVSTEQTSVVDVGGTEHPPSEDALEKAISDTRISVNRVHEMLGMLPILLVDDSVSILKMTKRAIQNECANISFMEAKNGEEALARVVEDYASFELIITDIQMPVCDGFEFTRRVRKMELDKGLKPKLIIGISANDQQKIADEANECGMV